MGRLVRVAGMLAVLACAAGCMGGPRFAAGSLVHDGGISTGFALGEFRGRADVERNSSGPETGTADSRVVVRTAWLRIASDDPEAAVPRACEMAKAHGGWVQRSTEREVVLRIPEANLDACLAAIGGLGDVEDQDVQAQDVTLQYHDLRIRLDNLERARARYQALLDKAANVAEALAVEKELERVTTQIEQLKVQQQVLQSLVAHATVTVRFHEASSPGPIGWLFYSLYVGIRWLFVWD